MALKDKKRPSGFKINDALAAEINAALAEDGTLTCAAAFRLSAQTGLPPKEIGRTLDALLIPISRCDLGLFGHPGRVKAWEDAPAEAIPAEWMEDLRSAAPGTNRIPCLALWKFAESRGISRMQAGLAADRAGLRIFACQLGAF